MTRARPTRSTERRQPIRVLLVEDADIVRDRLRAMLSENPLIEVVAEATGVRDSIAAIADASPDVIVLDMRLRDGSGLDLLRHLHAHARAPRVIVLTNFPEPQIRAECLAAGAQAFLDKSTEFFRVTDAITGRVAA